MSAGAIVSLVPVYGLALWLGLYLIARDPRSLRLLPAGLGLVAYALALAGDLLVDAVPDEARTPLARARWPLLLLPALCWTVALLALAQFDAARRMR